MPSDRQVLIYCDEGVSTHSFQETYDGIKSFLPFKVKAIKHDFFTSPGWEEKTALIVFPGGRDTPYHHLLQGQANHRIASYIQKGGCYLGICAGAYYGAACFEFEKGNLTEIIATRELAFFPGKAIGPLYSKCHLAPIQWVGENGITHLYYNGGCYFQGPQSYPTVSILAKYHDHDLAAIVQCQVGKGKAILSGVHPEFSSSEDHLSSLLQKNEKKRALFWNRLLNLLIKN